MTTVTDTVVLMLALAMATYACRASGYWLMGWVKLTPRVEAALKAAPLAVMIGIVAPAAVRGSVPEVAGIAAAAAMMVWRGHDLAAALVAMVVVATLRAWTG